VWAVARSLSDREVLRAGRLPACLFEENAMSINKDQVKGHAEEAKGAIKEATGKLVGNPSLELKGNIEKNLGKAQVKIGEAREDLKKASNPG
jgi:uncharacterized protein YjbJ (UPF0337 family)